MQKILNTLREKLKKSGQLGIIAVIIVLGIALLTIPTGGDGSDGGNEIPDSAAAEQAAEEMPFSLAETERRIERLLGEIDGAGRVAVMLTLRSGGETFIATDKTYSDRGEGAGRDQTEDAVIIGSGGAAEAPVVIKRGYPEYLGALVVAEGAGNPEVRLRLLGAVTSLTGLGAGHVEIAPMRQRTPTPTPRSEAN
ncbi:MAG: hypothetical protein LBH17_06435 [Oscillospiraceae bacterium]|nr:hypothetical protein [Oscillospiraceae bacterium]